jgi:beta-aspartyl-peptidase (threonine type)
LTSAALVVHGGAGNPPETELAQRQAAVERGLDAGWASIKDGALAAVVAAVRRLEDEPILNAGIGACLNSDGVIELDAGVMVGDGLRAGGVAAVTDVRHPVDLAQAIMEDGRHVLLAGDGASRFAREHGVETCDPKVFLTSRQLARWQVGDTVGAVARDAGGRFAVAVSTGGRPGKLPGRVGDSPIPGAGFYADDRRGAACATGEGEGFMRLLLCHHLVIELAHGYTAQSAADGAVQYLEQKTGGRGGLIVIDAQGEVAAAHNTPYMAWAKRVAGG